ncbi:MAG: hypothetical protein HY301_14580 [Verrucomicrobia bacterium]|nr:hypothetical protein [Verrucomicrobiota bacterium]
MKLYDEAVDYSIATYRKAGETHLGQAIYWTIIGALFILFGTRSEHGDAFFLIGLILIVMAVWNYQSSRKLMKSCRKPRAGGSEEGKFG